MHETLKGSWTHVAREFPDQYIFQFFYGLIKQDVLVTMGGLQNTILPSGSSTMPRNQAYQTEIFEFLKLMWIVHDHFEALLGEDKLKRFARSLFIKGGFLYKL